MVKVSGTRIFARSDGMERQFLVYNMSFAAVEDVAMILPVPVPPGSAEESVRFIDLSGYPGFFDALDQAFPQDLKLLAAQSLERSRATSPPPPLVVRTVGAFDASFVPTLADFSRLDRRFRMSDGVWAQLPAYHDFGFAVFKLRRPNLLARWFGSKPTQVHPMAFSFPSRHPDRLFFPTVHVHDGSVHKEASFDHTLYYQPATGDDLSIHHIGTGSIIPHEARIGSRPAETPERGPFARFADLERSRGILARDRPGYRLKLLGWRLNRDTVLELRD